jgi:hypothetical protein
MAKREVEQPMVEDGGEEIEPVVHLDNLEQSVTMKP